MRDHHLRPKGNQRAYTFIEQIYTTWVVQVVVSPKLRVLHEFSGALMHAKDTHDWETLCTANPQKAGAHQAMRSEILHVKSSQ